MRTLNEFLVKRHVVETPKYLNYDKSMIVDDMMFLAGKDAKITYGQGQLKLLNGKKIHKMNGEIPSWVYIWKYAYDHPNCTIKDISDDLIDKFFYGDKDRFYDILDIAVLSDKPAIKEIDNKYIAINPKYWK